MKDTLYTPKVQAAIKAVARNLSAKTGGAVDADELFSAGECAVAEHMAGFDLSRGRFEGWACQRARWAMQDYLRSIDPVSRRQRAKGVLGNPSISVESLPGNFLDATGNTTEADRGEMSDDIKRAMGLIDRLTPIQQKIIRAHFLDGVSQVELARKMKRTPQDIFGIIKRGLVSLRRMHQYAPIAGISVRPALEEAA